MKNVLKIIFGIVLAAALSQPSAFAIFHFDISQDGFISTPFGGGTPVQGSLHGTIIGEDLNMDGLITAKGTGDPFGGSLDVSEILFFELVYSDTGPGVPLVWSLPIAGSGVRESISLELDVSSVKPLSLNVATGGAIYTTDPLNGIVGDISLPPFFTSTTQPVLQIRVESLPEAGNTMLFLGCSLVALFGYKHRYQKQA